ncbi:MAG: MATE family efflux transporter [Oscillospiraceae bacterium]|nr:MATE family efflux transporter [Oscillospiraceae bacterium]
MQDLTEGRPLKVLWAFSIPLLLSTAFQQLYNIADSVIVGRFTGSVGLAAIGAAYPITLFFIACATGASMGCSVIIGQIYGAKDWRKLKSAASTALISMTALGVLLAVLGVCLAGPLMTLLNANDTIFADAKSYLSIYSIGVLFMMAYNTASSIFTGMGDSKRPLYFLLFSSALNVVLDIIAVGPLSMGVAGAAWATTISQAIAAVLSTVLALRRVGKLETAEKAPLFDGALLKQMCHLALPSIFQQSCVALTHTILQSLVNTFDVSVIAGYEAASKLHNFAYMSFNTMGTALSSFTAQCWGAGKRKRIKEGFWVSTGICFALTMLVIAIFQIFPKALIGLFVDAGEEAMVIEVGVNYLRIISPVYTVICFIITTGGLLRGLGKSMTFFVETVAEFAVRVTMCFVLTSALASYTGLMWAWYFGSSVGFILCMILYIRQKNTLLKE